MERWDRRRGGGPGATRSRVGWSDCFLRSTISSRRILVNAASRSRLHWGQHRREPLETLDVDVYQSWCWKSNTTAAAAALARGREAANPAPGNCRQHGPVLGLGLRLRGCL